MEIRGLSNPVATLLGQRKSVDPTQDIAAITAGATSDTTATASANSTLGDILSEYDLHKITPQKFSELIDRLKQADVLTSREHLQLGQLRQSLESAGIKSDQPIDLLDFLKKKIADLRQNGEAAKNSDDPTELSAIEASLKLAQDQNDWLSKLDAARRDRPLAGLDTKV
jgi:hypothetical protein